MNSKEFSLIIEGVVKDKRPITYMDAIIWYCEENKIEGGVKTTKKPVKKAILEYIKNTGDFPTAMKKKLLRISPIKLEGKVYIAKCKIDERGRINLPKSFLSANRISKETNVYVQPMQVPNAIKIIFSEEEVEK